MSISNEPTVREVKLIGETVKLKELSFLGKEKLIYVLDDSEVEQKIKEIYCKKVFIFPRTGCERALIKEVAMCAFLKNCCSSEYLATSMELLEEGLDGVFIADLAEGDMSHPQFLSSLKGNFEATLNAFLDVCRAGATIHAQNIAHGDIKPENFLVYLDQKNTYKIKLSDWGKTKNVEPGEKVFMMGNARYSPPEQLTSCQGDVYSLGLIGIQLFENMLNMQEEERIAAFLLPSKTTGTTLAHRIFARIVGETFASSKQDSIHAHIDRLQEEMTDRDIPQIDANLVCSLLWDMTMDFPEHRCSSHKVVLTISRFLDLSYFLDHSATYDEYKNQIEL